MINLFNNQIHLLPENYSKLSSFEPSRLEQIAISMMKTERLELTEQEISGEQKLNEKQIEKIKSLLAMLDFDLSFEN